MKKHIKKILIGLAVIAVLVSAFFLGSDVPENAGENTSENSVVATQVPMDEPTQMPFSTVLPTERPEPTMEVMQSEESAEPVVQTAQVNSDTKVIEENNIDSSKAIAENKEDNIHPPVQGMMYNNSREMDNYYDVAVPEGRPAPIEPQNVVISDKAMTCTLTVRCDSILADMSRLDSAKAELVPYNGVILEKQNVTFYEGESVFNVLLREMKKNKIHFEFENTPIYNSAYIEGINNLYEFDCGELSGWMYRVNGWFPNYGCSRYKLREGDVIEWVYTCDLGRDIGGIYEAGE